MKRRAYRNLSLDKKLAFDCEYTLAEAAALNESGGEWLVEDSTGKEFAASLCVDEEMLDVFIDVKNTETDDVEYRFKLEVSCNRVELPPSKES